MPRKLTVEDVTLLYLLFSIAEAGKPTTAFQSDVQMLVQLVLLVPADRAWVPTQDFDIPEWLETRIRDEHDGECTNAVVAQTAQSYIVLWCRLLAKRWHLAIQ